uniref:Tubulin tyrosine ligase-like family, member 4 n=1 Tax=Denticeps clupeoides TaxID=299321 RepID=A0AAY4AUF0_9TELE
MATDGGDGVRSRRAPRPPATAVLLASGPPAVHDKLRSVSGSPSQRAYPGVPAPRARRAPVATCHVAGPLQLTVQGCRPRWCPDPLRFRPGLLGKRASSPQRSVYPACPSPPKAVSVGRTMPANQSSPWSGAERGVVCTRANVPSCPRLDADEPQKLSVKMTRPCVSFSDMAVPVAPGGAKGSRDWAEVHAQNMLRNGAYLPDALIPSLPPPFGLSNGDDPSSKDNSVCTVASCPASGLHHSIPEEPGETSAAPPSPTVHSVTNQISAIHLTRTSSGHPDFTRLHLPPLSDALTVGSDGDSPPGDAHGSIATSVDCSEPAEDDRVERPALVPSLFPLRPPTLYFSTANERVQLLPWEQRKLLKWKMSSVTPNVVKQTIARSHFRATKKSDDWLGCWGHHMKSPGFKAIHEYQKLNHFPGSFQIGRKDRLWRNLSKMQARFGKREFSFFPRSFVLPQDLKLLKKAWEDGGGRQKWIIKPPASARGIGIQVIHKWSQMPRKRPLLVQKYLHKPYLISGNKFDLRIYVYVTSYDPLRVYIFSDGLVRFASCKYSSSMKSLSNKFMHLTNYSVNKKNSEYQTNSDHKACQGHKWALKALWQYLSAKGINTTQIWEMIKDMVIKTIIASDPYVNMLVKANVRSPYSCHELFGFDIMLDENLKPWVLEVNISPSLHSNTALDVSIKGQMIRDVLNLAGFVVPRREEMRPAACGSTSSSTSSLCGGVWERSRPELSADEKVKRAFYLSQRFADQLFSSVLDVLTPDDVNVLAEAEDELSRRGEFERVFPSPASSRYLRFFEHPRYLNILLSQWEQKHWQNRSQGSPPFLCYMYLLPSLSKTSFAPVCSVLVSQGPRSAEEDDVSDREVHSVTSSLPDISLMDSGSPSPSSSPSSSLASDL